jgi:hypothetical protein
MAQVLYYHRWPTTFNWNAMLRGPYLTPGSAPELARLMQMCGNSVGVVYNDGGSKANTADVNVL